MRVSWSLPPVTSLCQDIMGYRVYYCNVLDDLKLNGWKNEDCLDPLCSHVEITLLRSDAIYAVHVSAMWSGGRLGSASETYYCGTVDTQLALDRRQHDNNNYPVAMTTTLAVRNFTATLNSESRTVTLSCEPPHNCIVHGYKIIYEGRAFRSVAAAGQYEVNKSTGSWTAVDPIKEILVAHSDRQFAIHRLICNAVYVISIYPKLSFAGYGQASNQWLDTSLTCRPSAVVEWNKQQIDDVIDLQLQLKTKSEELLEVKGQFDEYVRGVTSSKWKLGDLKNWIKEWKAEKSHQLRQMADKLARRNYDTSKSDRQVVDLVRHQAEGELEDLPAENDQSQLEVEIGSQRSALEEVDWTKSTSHWRSLSLYNIDCPCKHIMTRSQSTPRVDDVNKLFNVTLQSRDMVGLSSDVSQYRPRVIRVMERTESLCDGSVDSVQYL